NYLRRRLSDSNFMQASISGPAPPKQASQAGPGPR
uniref:Synapsin I (Fragments) n=1 Tax=Rattus norvegicus TaxID=10116 RepID=Q7M033_RAT